MKCTEEFTMLWTRRGWLMVRTTRSLVRPYRIYASLSAVNNLTATLTDHFVIRTRNANAVM